MKTNHWIFISGIVALTLINLLGCSGQPTTIPQPIVLTPSPVSTEVVGQPTPTLVSGPSPTTATLLASSSPTSSPALTSTLPVLIGMPVPMPNEPITPANVDRIQQLALWGNGQVRHVTYSPDGKTLAIGTTAGVGLYDAQTLEVRRFIQTNSSIVTMAFWPDDQLVAYQEDSTISCWHTNTGELGGNWRVGSMAAFAPNGKNVVAMLANGQIVLWQIENCRLLDPLKYVPGAQEGEYVFSPDGQRLASNWLGGQINIWNMLDGTSWFLSGFSDILEAKATELRFSPDGRLLVASAQNTSRVWEVESRNFLFEIPEATALAFSPDGQFLAARAEDKVIKIWDISQQTWQQTVSTPGLFIDGLTFSPNGRHLISWEGHVKSSLLRWDTGALKLLDSLPVGEQSAWHLAFPSDNGGASLGWRGTEQGLQLWDLNTGQVGRTLTGQPEPARQQVSLSANGKMLAILSTNFTTWLWDLQTNRLLKTLNLDSTGSSDASQMVISPNGQFLFFNLDIFDVQTGRKLPDLWTDKAGPFPISPRPDALFSPDNTMLATGTPDQTVALWEVQTGQLLRHLVVPDEVHFFGKSFSPKGDMLATVYGASKIRIWNPKTGELLAQLPGHPRRNVFSIAFSPDGAILASGSDSGNMGGEIRLWEVKTGRLLRAIDTPAISRLGFTPDGDRLVLEMRNLTIQHWGVPPE